MRVLVIGLLVALWFGTDQSAAAAPKPTEGYVTVNGQHFELNGLPFLFQGTNFYRLGIIDHQSDTEVYDIMRQYEERGIKVVRIWGFACGDGNKRSMIKAVTKGQIEYDPVALRRLDLAVDAARNFHIKIVLPLVNYQSEYCPMSWWVKQITGSSDQQLFYSDPDVRSLFKQHITNLLSRTNTIYVDKNLPITKYSDDRTIMAIEMANEPHTEDNYEFNHNIPPGQLVFNWLSEMTDHVRSVDPHHLISSGEEGYKVSPSGPEEAARHSWLTSGVKGVDFVRNLTLPNIDFATVHPYPANWGIPITDMDWFAANFIADRATIARKAGKPILLEETGFSFASSPWLGYGTEPSKGLAEIYKAATMSGYAGMLAWELVPPGSEEGDYVFDFKAPGASVIFNQVGVFETQTRSMIEYLNNE